MTSERDPGGGARGDGEPYDYTEARPAATPAPQPDEFLDEAAPSRETAPSTGTADVPASAPAAAAEESTRAGKRGRSPNMLPGRERRTLGLERLLVRVIATAGVVGIGVVIAAIMASSKSQGWIIGLVVAIVSVVLSAILWSSRQL